MQTLWERISLKCTPSSQFSKDFSALLKQNQGLEEKVI